MLRLSVSVFSINSFGVEAIKFTFKGITIKYIKFGSPGTSKLPPVGLSTHCLKNELSKIESIRLCKNYTKVTQWCGCSAQWTQYAVDAVE